MSNTNKTHYIKSAAVRKLAKSLGKRTATEFLASLDRYVEAKVTSAAKEHNGGKKTLDSAIAAYYFGTR